MIVTILGKQFPIQVSEKPIVHDGIACNAILQRAPRRRILLSPTLSPADRYREVIHEARHAWTAEFGVPGGDEDDARSVAVFVDEITQQLDAQGGRDALMRLEPLSQRQARGSIVALNTRHTCRTCGADTMSGSVKQSAPMFNETYAVHTIEREFECEPCGTVNRWTEVSTERGEPLGQPLPGREYQTV